MKKLTMVITLLMMMTMNLFADATGVTVTTVDCPDDSVVGQVVGQITATPATPGNIIIYSFKDKTNNFEVDANTGVVTLKAGFQPLVSGDTIGNKRLQAKEQDGGGINVGAWVSGVIKLNVTITDGVNEPVVRPTVDTDAYAVDDTLVNGDVVTTLTATGGTGPFTYNENVLDGTKEVDGVKNSANFNISSTGEITVQNALMTAGNVYSYEIFVHNTETGSTLTTITITAESAGAPVVKPTITSTDTYNIYSTQGYTTFGSVVATSDTGITGYAISSGADSGDFYINGSTGALLWDGASATIPVATYTFNVTATDTDPDTSDEFAITVNVTAAPVSVSIDVQSFNLGELEANTYSLGTVATTGGTGSLTFSQNGTPSTVFAVSAAGEVTLIDASAMDFEEVSGSKTFTLSVHVEDSAGTPTTDDLVITINVTNENEVTLASGQSRSIFDDATGNVGAALNYTTENQPTNQFSMTGDEGDFAIDATGQITIIGTLAVQTYNLVVTVTDTVSGDSEAQSVDIIVDAVVLTNWIDDHNVGSVDENVTGVTLDVTAVAGSTFSIADTTYFTIDNGTGVLTLNSPIDFEFEGGSYDLDVTANKDSVDDTATVTVTVNDLDDNGVVSILDQTRAIDENSSASTNVGAALTLDVATFPGNIEFTTSDPYFNVGLTSGQLTVAAGTVLDWETTTSYNVVVNVVDNISGDNSSANITVNVNDVYEGSAPSIGDQSFDIYVGDYVTGDVTILEVVASGDDLQFTDTNPLFDVNSSTGFLTVIDSSSFVAGFSESFLVTVTNTVTNDTDTATITINVLSKPAAPNPYNSPRKKKKNWHDKACIIEGLNGYSLFLGFTLMSLALILASSFRMPRKA